MLRFKHIIYRKCTTSSVVLFGRELTVKGYVVTTSPYSSIRTVSDSLNYEPERCTVVAMYKKIVIGVALLNSPQETYMTYLAVRAGWENAQVGT